MRLVIRPTADEGCLFLARYLVQRINNFAPTASRPFVLGLPTGSSPEGIYRYLVDFHKRGLVSFRNVVTFNMDEYVGLPRDHSQSYHTFMYKHLFSHIDIQPQNVHILDGTAKNLEQECRNYEAKIAAMGGIELFLGGVGSDGHIAFNEPGSSLSSRTRIKTLVPATITANARFFSGDVTQVPRMALTVGVGTVFDAREVCIIATGAGKAEAVRQGVDGSIGHEWTITKLQDHPRWLMVVDEDACSELKLKTVKVGIHLEDEQKANQPKYFKDIEGVAASMGFNAAGLEEDKRPWEKKAAKL